jgi:hypothetical protein
MWPCRHSDSGDMLDSLNSYAQRIGPELGSPGDAERMPLLMFGSTARVAVPVRFLCRLAFS